MSDHIPLSWLFTALAVMLLVAGFFSIAETSMMAINRNRLKHLVREGRRSARLTQALLERTDRLLGVILVIAATMLFAINDATNKHLLATYDVPLIAAKP